MAKSPADKNTFILGRDYYIDKGRYVFTALYLEERGYCCKNACRHCPYGFRKKVED
ncbi:MAG: DUF5522 domain-containing protein [Bacteroidota bacterium]